MLITSVLDIKRSRLHGRATLLCSLKVNNEKSEFEVVSVGSL